MAGDIMKFFENASAFVRNPLGIIGLCIVLVYGIACLVFSRTSLQPVSETLLVGFLVTYPFAIIAVLAWLVSRHSQSLFAPRDFRNEDNYVLVHLAAAASLAAAVTKKHPERLDTDINGIVETIWSSQPAIPRQKRRNEILWVDDNPDNNTYERQAFEALGLKFTLATTTDEALKAIHPGLSAVISDMNRREGAREGHKLLVALRARGIKTPFFIYSGAHAREHKEEILANGGQGSTNSAQELFAMVTHAL